MAEAACCKIMSAPLPERIGKYTISALLGRGAMGVIYKGFDPHIARPVAIKTINRELLEDDQLHASIAARFRNEAQAVGRLQHAGIVAIYEFGEDESTAYIAMEYVEGKNLEQVLALTPLLPEAQVLRIMMQLLDALECAHQHGVWHRDIKPANVILARDGQVKLADFGIARIENQNLTQVASMIGTPGYMAPEQYVGEGIDHRADLFAAGVVLYRLLSGTPPFTGSAESVMYRILNEHPRPPSQVSPRPLSNVYDALLSKALAKQSLDRFQSAPAFRQALWALGAQAIAIDAEGANDATVIASQRGAAGAPGGASSQAAQIPSGSTHPGGAPRSPTSTGIGPARFATDQLVRIERALAVHMGPMAKILVRQAALLTSDLASLAADLAQHIPDDQQRQRFVSEITAGSQARTLTGAGAGVPTPQSQPGLAGTDGAGAGNGALAAVRSAAPSADVVNDAVKAHVLAVLTRHMGPIAKVVVKRAGDRAQTRTQLIQLLLESAAEADRPALFADLQTMC